MHQQDSVFQCILHNAEIHPPIVRSDPVVLQVPSHRFLYYFLGMPLFNTKGRLSQQLLDTGSISNEKETAHAQAQIKHLLT